MDEKRLIKWIRKMPQSEHKHLSTEQMEQSFNRSKLQSLLKDLIMANSMLRSQLDLISEESSKHS